MSFHPRTGTLVLLSNGNRTAHRRHSSTEFNNGLVISAEPLRDNHIFEVKIDKKLNSWSGSIEIGVTVNDPDTLAFPASATGLRDGTWILSGTNVLKDGHSISEDYGIDLDNLMEDDCVGVMRTSSGALHFFVNGIDQGVAIHDVPGIVYAIVDLYGKCTQVSISGAVAVDNNQSSHAFANELANEALAEAATVLRSYTNLVAMSERLAFHEKCGTLVKLSNGGRTAERRRPTDEFNNGVVMTNRPLRPGELFEICLDCLIDKWSGSIEVGVTTHNPADLDFPATMTNMRSGTIMMSGCGILTNGKGTQKDYGHFNLDELLEGDRIGLIRKPNGNLHFFINGIDQGIAADEAPEVIWGVVDLYGMTIKVTIVDDNGKTVEYPPGELTAAAADAERRANSIYRQLLLAADAARGIGQQLSAGEGAMAMAATTGRTNVRGTPAIATPPRGHRQPAVDNNGDEHTPQHKAPTVLLATAAASLATATGVGDDSLRFHLRCGRRVTLSRQSRSASRSNPLQDFNDGVLLTHRVLRADEVLEVRIDRVVDKWAGSIEIGVTSLLPALLDFPSTMTNQRSGTWLMTADGIVHDGVTATTSYGTKCSQLQRLKVGDKVGVVRKLNGDLHFFINGVDQGLAAQAVPSDVYGVIDLYGQAAEATIVDSAITVGVDGRELRFHSRHGKNCSLINDGKTAVRPDPRNEFNDAIVMSNRPLKDNELFEIVIESTVERWSGSIECGVTVIKPEDMDFPGTVCDLATGTWLWSGHGIVRDCMAVQSEYGCNLDTLGIGSKIGIMRTGGGLLRFFVNGIDQGVACDDVSPGVYAIVNLYGQCAQVSFVCSAASASGNSAWPAAAVERPFTASLAASPAAWSPVSSAPCASVTTGSSNSAGERAGDARRSTKSLVTVHRFNQCCGKNVTLRNDGVTACRVRGFDHGTVFSADPVKDDETFEIVLDQVARQWSGSLRIGLTTMTISESTHLSVLQPSATDLHPKGRTTWLVCGSEVKKNGIVTRENYCTALERLAIGCRVGIKRAADATMHVIINGEDFGVAATGIPRNTFVVVDIYGSVDTVSVRSSTQEVKKGQSPSAQTPRMLASPESPGATVKASKDSSEPCRANFHPMHHGQNIALINKARTAVRTNGYSEGVVFSCEALQRNQMFKVRIDRLNTKWSCSVMIGVASLPASSADVPCTATILKESSWFIRGNSVFRNGKKVREHYCCDLGSLSVAHTIGVLLDQEDSLHLYINDVDQGVAVRDIGGSGSQLWHGFVDLYGSCEQVSVIDADALLGAGGGNFLEGREKADMEISMKENPQKSLIEPCAYQSLCDRFRKYLALPDAFFKAKYHKCFCETCWRQHCGTASDYGLRHNSSGGEGDENEGHCASPYRLCGSPPRRYALPLGWCCFGLRVKSRAKVHKIFENWHVAFHEARAESVRRVLDTADLLSTGCTAKEGGMLLPHSDSCCEAEKNSDGRDLVQLSLSPTLKLIESCRALSQSVEYQDDQTKKTHQCRLAFQLCVKPGSYAYAPPHQAVTTNEQVDPKFNNNEIKWLTKERGATEISGLLIRVD